MNKEKTIMETGFSTVISSVNEDKEFVTELNNEKDVQISETSTKQLISSNKVDIYEWTLNENPKEAYISTYMFRKPEGMKGLGQSNRRHLFIPDYFEFLGDKYYVTKIEKNVFCNQDIVSLKLPTKIKTIESGAFSGNDKLRSVNFSELKDLNQYLGLAFPNCLFFKQIKGQGLYRLSLADCFAGEIGLKLNRFDLEDGISEVKIPESFSFEGFEGYVKHVDMNCFNDLRIESLFLNSKIKMLGTYCFSPNLKVSNISNIQEKAKETNSEVITAVYHSFELFYKVPGEGTYEINAFMVEHGFAGVSIKNFIPEEGVKNISIPETIPVKSLTPSTSLPFLLKEEKVHVTHIMNRAFFNLGLESVILPKHLNHLGESSFAHNNLREIVLPKRVTNLQKNTFEGNKELSRIKTLGEGFEKLNCAAFSVPCDLIWTALTKKEVFIYNEQTSQRIKISAQKIEGSLKFLELEKEVIKNTYEYVEFPKANLIEINIGNMLIILEPIENSIELREESIKFQTDISEHWKDLEVGKMISYKIKLEGKEVSNLAVYSEDSLKDVKMKVISLLVSIDEI